MRGRGKCYLYDSKLYSKSILLKEYAPESFITTYDGNQLIALGIRESLSL